MTASNPTTVFLRKMAKQDATAKMAAHSLLQFAEQNPSKVQRYAKQLASYSNSPSLPLRALAANTLAVLGTVEAIGMLFDFIAQQGKGALSTQVDAVDHFTPEPLIFWMVSGLSNHAEDASDDFHKRAVAELIKIACEPNKYDEITRAIIMREIYFYTQSYRNGYRATVEFPRALYDSTLELCESTDEMVVSEALNLLSHISNRIERVPTLAHSESKFVRIDFDQADLPSLLSHYGPQRFAALHPEDFEHFVVRIFRKSGFEVEETSYSGDFGADLIATKENVRTAVQVKRYTPGNNVSVADVNQVIGAREYYKCDKSLVITTSDFTKPAVSIAEKARVILWNWDTFAAKINSLFGKILL